MKPINNLKWLIALLFIGISFQPALAQTKANISDGSTPITWLGVDYSQAKIIGQAYQWEHAGEINSAEVRYKYIDGWNQLFVVEQKKYDVAKAVHRGSVNYAIDVTQKANNALTKDFFTNNPGDFHKLTEQDISNVVKNYDFGTNTGIGLIFFVEGMSKGIESMGVWVTFVDMKSKTVLQTTYKTAKPGGFGFKNYWAKPLYTILKEM